jgi:hypothetical protein
MEIKKIWHVSSIETYLSASQKDGKYIHTLTKEQITYLLAV